MSYEVFEPSRGSAHDKLGIVLFNHLGSAVSQDTGRDAQYMSNAHRLPVIAANRPGSGL